MTKINRSPSPLKNWVQIWICSQVKSIWWPLNPVSGNHWSPSHNHPVAFIQPGYLYSRETKDHRWEKSQDGVENESWLRRNLTATPQVTGMLHRVEFWWGGQRRAVHFISWCQHLYFYIKLLSLMLILGMMLVSLACMKLKWNWHLKIHNESKTRGMSRWPSAWDAQGRGDWVVSVVRKLNPPCYN